MKKYIYIVAYVNDGDYVYKLNKISDKSLEKLIPLIDIIKENKKNKVSYEFIYYDTSCPFYLYCKEKGITEDVLNFFCSFMPLSSNENDEVYDIESVKILEVLNIIELV